MNSYDSYNDKSVVALGGATAALFAAEARNRGFCAAWAFQQTIDDFEMIARRIWRPKAKSMMDLLNGYGHDEIVASPYARQGDCRDRMKADMWDALMKPSVHVAVFVDEIPKPTDPNGVNLTFFPDNKSHEWRNYRRRMKKAIEFLGKRGRVAVVTQQEESPRLRNPMICLDHTKRYWRPILETCLPLYSPDGRASPEAMSGFAKMAFMLIARS